MFGDFFSPLFDLSDSGFLLDDQSLEVLEKLGELDHLSFDLLDILVTLRDVSRNGLSLAATVALDQSGAENLLVAWILNRLTNFSVRGIWSNNSVLSGHLLLGGFAEFPLDLLVLVDSSL